ncbi:MAG: 16S rRNA (guanine(966)-N(2))-methyltransferase RsmD [Dongiaceae bacterium]
MRIVGGRHRGRRLVAPAGIEVRPTSERAREALFNILAHGNFRADGTSPITGARVLDGFAGSGALGLEALSRGADHAVFMENARAALKAIGDNIRLLGETDRATVMAVDAAKPPPAIATCHVVLLDPPYGSGLAAPALEKLAAGGWFAPGAICSVEVSAKEPLAVPAGFKVIDERRHGRAKLILLRAP